MLPGPPHVHENEKLGADPVCVRVMAVPSVHCAVQAKMTSALVPDRERRRLRACRRRGDTAGDAAFGGRARADRRVEQLEARGDSGAPLCVMVTVCPAIVSVPDARRAGSRSDGRRHGAVAGARMRRADRDEAERCSSPSTRTRCRR